MGNTIRTNGAGVGLSLSQAPIDPPVVSAGYLSAKVEGNDLRNNLVA